MPHYVCIVEAINSGSEEDRAKDSQQRDDPGNKAEALGNRRKLFYELCQCPLMLSASLLVYYQ